MKTKASEKAFDCLINKWQVEEQIYNETKDMTDNELVEYFKKSVIDSSLGNWWESLKHKDKPLHLHIK